MLKKLGLTIAPSADRICYKGIGLQNAPIHIHTTLFLEGKKDQMCLFLEL